MKFVFIQNYLRQTKLSSLSSQGTAFSTDKFYNADDILLSYFARANYDFKAYLASATFRADGSSKFSKDNRWGFFPSAALAWRMSSENFMKVLNHG